MLQPLWRSIARAINDLVAFSRSAIRAVSGELVSIYIASSRSLAPQNKLPFPNPYLNSILQQSLDTQVILSLLLWPTALTNGGPGRFRILNSTTRYFTTCGIFAGSFRATHCTNKQNQAVGQVAEQVHRTRVTQNPQGRASRSRFISR